MKIQNWKSQQLLWTMYELFHLDLVSDLPLDQLAVHVEPY